MYIKILKILSDTVTSPRGAVSYGVRYSYHWRINIKDLPHCYEKTSTGHIEDCLCTKHSAVSTQ